MLFPNASKPQNMKTSGILTNLYVPDHVAVLKCYVGNEVCHNQSSQLERNQENLMKILMGMQLDNLIIITIILHFTIKLGGSLNL